MNPEAWTDSSWWSVRLYSSTPQPKTIYIIICLLEWGDLFMKQPTSGKRTSMPHVFLTERPRLWLDIACHGPRLAGLCPACCGVCWCNLAMRHRPSSQNRPNWSLGKPPLGCVLKETSSCSRFLKLPGNLQQTLQLFVWRENFQDPDPIWIWRPCLIHHTHTHTILLHLEGQQLMLENIPDCCLYSHSVICCHYYIAAGYF